MYQWPKNTSFFKKSFYTALGFFYFLSVILSGAKDLPYKGGILRYTQNDKFTELGFLLNLIRGAQFWIFRFTKQKCLWSTLSIAPYELLTKQKFILDLNYKLENNHVKAHASSGEFLQNEEYARMIQKHYANSN